VNALKAKYVHHLVVCKSDANGKVFKQMLELLTWLKKFERAELTLFALTAPFYCFAPAIGGLPMQ
jgi:hypothetical protein